MIKLLRDIPRQLLIRLIPYQILGMVPINYTMEEDIFIIGYPKSGNTWFQNLVASLLYGVSAELCPDVLIQDLVPDVLNMPYYRRYGTPMFFKSHLLPRPEYRNVVYLIRDGRDSMVSYIHHLRALHGDQVDFQKVIKEGNLLGFGKWHEHVEQWLANPYKSNLTVLKYEDLHSNPLHTMQQFCEFSGLERSKEAIQRAIGATSFEKMQLSEEKFGWASSSFWPKDKQFVRRGQVGSYRDEMPAEILDLFMSEAEPTLTRCGYV